MKPEITTIQNAPDAATFTLTEAGRLLGITRQAVLHRIKKGKLAATQVCKDWYITGEALKTQLRVRSQ